jgi:bacterioferritin (cytochrome b1)
MARPLDQEPAYDKGGATRAPSLHSGGPLLDLADAAVKRMIKLAKKRGYITHDELDDALPPEELSVEQIEDVLSGLAEMGIRVCSLDEAPLDNKSAATEPVEPLSDGSSFHQYRTDMTVARLIRIAQKRGYVTYDELNEVLRPKEFTSKQVEDVLRQHTHLGIEIIKSEEADEILRARVGR